MVNIRDFVEQDAWSYLRSKGITPGWRTNNGPETFQSDLVEEAADKIMGNREELADVLGTIFENLAPPAVTDMLALLTVRSPVDDAGELTAEFVAADAAMMDAIGELVYAYCKREAGL